MLFATPPLSAEEARVLEAIEALKERLGLRVAVTPRRWYGTLRRTAFARAVQGSNTIEGYDVALDDAIAAAEGEEPLDPKTEAWAAVTGYRSAMTWVLQLADDPHFTYSTELLKGLHFMMMNYNLAKQPGRWRLTPVQVQDDEAREIVYVGPPPVQVPGLVDELVAELNQGMPAAGSNVVQAAMAHLNLVMIHPFADGNGRMARCLQTLVLARTGTLAPPFSSIEEYLGRNSRAYYDVLAEVGGGSYQPASDARPWIRFCLTAHYRQATTLLLRARETARLWDALEAEIHIRTLPERVIFALADAALGMRVRNATYRPIAEVSDQVASRDLKNLTDQGMLVPKGEKRGRHYVASEWLLEVRGRTRETRRIEGPFEVLAAGRPLSSDLR